MRIHYDLDNLPAIERPVVTIGSFDGVHLGHAALLSEVIAEARRVGGRSVVVTFAPHPRQILSLDDDFRLLTPLYRKAELLEALGVDELVVIEFNRELAALTSEEFTREVLVGRIGMHTLIVGYNHRFGHDKDIPQDHFEQLGLRYGFGVVRASAFLFEGGKVSSSIIRRLLAEGRNEEAERLLGHKL